MWEPGMHILVAETHQKIKPEDLEVGTLVSAVPEGIDVVMEEEGNLNALAKAAVMLIRMDPNEIVADQTPPGQESWTYQGILCFSKICTHVGCALGLYEQLTHHMLCPCHQSTFDLADKGNVIFGPAARSLPQLAITVDGDGYLIAREGFTQPVGPSFWERG
jgi:ubiquinol-cytochrome c reductase iron-sulfur subunit